jgi:type II secretory pathway predicted ATPase ExeA
MYFQHFGLRSDPFPLTPRLHLLFQSRSHDETMAHLVYGIEQEESIVLITGGIGTGKTLALQNLISQLSGSLEPVLVNVTQFSWPELVRYILYEMGSEPGPELTPADLVFRLKTLLQERARAGRRVLLIIDEAHHLGVEALEGLRLLLNVGTSDRPALQLILAGQLALEDTIARRDLAQLGQRIRVRYRLEPLSRREAEEYIDHRIQVVGGRRGLFEERALDRIWSLSGGIPRVVNILASRALLAAFVARQDRVQPHHVREEDLPPLSDAEPEDTAAAPAAAASPVEAPPRAEASPPTSPPATAAVAGTPELPEAPPTAGPTPPPPDALPHRSHESPPRQRRRHQAGSRDGGGRRIALMVIPMVLLVVAVGVAWQLDLADLRTRLTTPLPAAPTAGTAVPEAGQPPGDAGLAEAPSREQPADPTPDPALEPAPGRETTPAAAPPAFVAHLASFQDATLAASYQELLEQAGVLAFSRTASVGGEAWVRVFIGPFETRDRARSRVQQLVRDGLADYAVVAERGS